MSGAGDSGVPPAIADAAALDALVRLQLADQEMSRHHDVMRDRAVASSLTVNSALLAFLGVLFQADGKGNAELVGAVLLAIPVVVIASGTAGFVMAARHSEHAARHWALARGYRRGAFDLMGRGVADRRIEAEAEYERRSLTARLFKRADGPNARFTRFFWQLPSAAIVLAGVVLLIMQITYAKAPQTSARPGGDDLPLPPPPLSSSQKRLP